MNPRVSRSSALASKATGFPIAKLAALLAVGYTLDELPNDITGKSSAAFEPALDYVAVKAPRFDFEKFPGDTRALGTEMRAVGEALGLGRTFPEALLKALEGVEAGDALPEIPGLHPYFTAELESIRTAERELAADGDVAAAKRFGLPDARIARILGVSESEVRSTPRPPGPARGRLLRRRVRGADAVLLPLVRGRRRRARRATGAIVVLGSGTNRIGQGIEFDYCCVRAAQAFRRLGHEVVLLNSNPETVSTDYDTCDRLYLEPVTLERVLDVVELERPLGVVVSLGGQTPLASPPAWPTAGVPLLGDPLAAIDAAEDRGRFGALLAELGLRAPRGARRTPTEEARDARGARSAIPSSSGRPTCSAAAGCASRATPAELELDGPALVDRYLEGALELDVDILCDGEDALGRGDPRARRAGRRPLGRLGLRPPRPLGRPALEAEIRDAGDAHSPRGLGARGLLNLQLALHERRAATCSRRTRAPRGRSRSSRRRPGVPLVDHACRLLLGASLAELGLPERVVPDRAWAKEAIFPRERFAGAADRGRRDALDRRGDGRAARRAAAAYRRALQAARTRAARSQGSARRSLPDYALSFSNVLP